MVEADWDLGIGVITYEWCKDGVSAQRDMLQCLPMEKFPRWRKALRANKPVVISDLQRLENVYPDEAAFFREYGVTTLLAAPFSKRINQGFIAVDDPTRYTDDPVFLFIASYAVVVELNEIKQQQSLLAATKASKYNPEDIHINFFGGMEIISSKGTLTGEDIKADQCYLLLAYLILNHKKNSTVDTLAEIICPYDELDSPYKVVNNIVYRLRRTLSVIGLDKLVIGKNGTFQINPNFNIHTDFDRFEDACIQLKTEENPDMRHSLYHSAVDMYKGQLLPRCEHELWLMQLSMYYQSLYLQITKGYVRLKMECKDYILAQKTAIDALRFDPKDSELNMYAILAMGFQGNLSMAQTYYTAAKPYLALEHAEVIKKYLNIQNDIGNRHSPTVIVAAITSRIKHHRLPTHVNLNGMQCGLHNESTIMLEQLRTLDKQRLLGYAGTVGKSKMREVNTALEISIGIKNLLPDNKRKRGSNYGKSEHREEKHQADPDDH